MGMSNDFQQAVGLFNFGGFLFIILQIFAFLFKQILKGSSYIRIGTSIFGQRDYQA